MKKILLFMSAFLILLTACSSNNVMGAYKIDKNNHFVTKDAKDIVQDMVDMKPGVYYIGFPECPWCQQLVPVLEDVLAEHDVTATYLNTRTNQFKDNEILQENFKKFRESFADGLQNGEAYVPFVVAIGADGTIAGHTGTYPNADPSIDLTEDQRDFVVKRLTYLVQVSLRK